MKANFSSFGKLARESIENETIKEIQNLNKLFLRNDAYNLTKWPKVI